MSITAFQLEQFMLRERFTDGEAALVREVAEASYPQANHLAQEIAKKKPERKGDPSTIR